MRAMLLVNAVLVTALALTASPGLGAQHEDTAVPSPLVGRWSHVVTHATWMRSGRDFPTTKVTIEVDRSGRQVGYWGPDYPPVPPSASPTSTYPDWYTDWKVAGTKLAIGAVPPCGWLDSFSGRYRWAVRGTTMTITRVADKCGDRIAAFSGTWKKAR